MLTTILPYEGYYRVLADGQVIGEESSLSDAQWLASDAREQVTVTAAQDTPQPQAHAYLINDLTDTGFWPMISGGRARRIGATS